MDNSDTFSDQISVHFGSARQFVLKSDLKKYCISPIFVQYDPRGVWFGSKLGPIGSKLEKYVNLKDQISVHFTRRFKNMLKNLIIKSPRCVKFGAILVCVSVFIKYTRFGPEMGQFYGKKKLKYFLIRNHYTFWNLIWKKNKKIP